MLHDAARVLGSSDAQRTLSARHGEEEERLGHLLFLYCFASAALSLLHFTAHSYARDKKQNPWKIDLES